MIKFEKLSYSFPQRDLYNNVSFTLEEGQHCAFIGASGSGKSTLIDIIMDPEKYLFDGKLEMEPNLKIGYVSQFTQRDKANDITVFEYIAEEFIKLENEIATLCAEMGTTDDIETVLEKYQEALDAFDAIDGDNYENNINKKLNIADFGNHRDRMISELSGGEFKLIQVIKEMLNNPDLMIMDEPDVFLDFENLNALKNLINSHKKTILVITHNRYLLNHCFNKIIHLENTELQEFDGRYIDYNFSLLQTKIELQEMAMADEEEIARNEALIEVLREKATYNADASRGRALKARVKIQERLEANRIKHPFVDIKQPYINLETNNEIEETIALKTSDFGISFDETLLENVNFEIKSTDKVAIVGTNGVGKTTLLRQIFKNNNESIKIDENISISDDILSKFFSNIEGFPFNTIGSTSIAFLIFYGTLESFKGNFTEHIKEIHKLSNTNIAYNIAQALDIADSYNTEKSMDITKFMDGVLALSIPDNSKIAILDTYSNYHKYVDEISIHLKASIDALEKEEESISDLLNNFNDEVTTVGCKNFFKEISQLKPIDDVNYHMKPFIFGMDTNITSNDSINDINIYCGILRKELLDMLNKQHSYIDEVYEGYNLLGDRTRFDILCYINKQNAYGQELSKHFNLSRNTIHHHMNKLINYGLVTCTTDGNRVYYSINTESFEELISHQQKLFCSKK